MILVCKVRLTRPVWLLRLRITLVITTVTVKMTVRARLIGEFVRTFAGIGGKDNVESADMRNKHGGGRVIVVVGEHDFNDVGSHRGGLSADN